MTSARTLLPLALLALPGCVVPIPVPEGTPGAFEIVVDPGDPCGAYRFLGFVGRDVAEVRAFAFDTPVAPRVLGPGQDAPGETNTRRVTFVADGSGAVTRVGCG